MNENNIEVHTPEMTAGEMLRNARTTGRRKREISTVAKQLCIREEFLQALEDGNYSQIPELVYILGFARNYAMELGLDPDEIVVKIKREMGLAPECADAADSCEDVAAMPAAAKTGAAGAFKTNMARAWGYVVRKWQWFAGGVALVLVLIIAAILMWPRAETAPVAQSAPVVADGGAAMAEPKYAVAVRERFGTENREDSNVILQASQESWVKIEDGRGNTVFSRVLVPGDVYYVPAGDRYRATFGNAGGVDIWVDGQMAPRAGADHVRRADILLTPSALMKNAN